MNDGKNWHLKKKSTQISNFWLTFIRLASMNVKMTAPKKKLNKQKKIINFENGTSVELCSDYFSWTSYLSRKVGLFCLVWDIYARFGKRWPRVCNSLCLIHLLVQKIFWLRSKHFDRIRYFLNVVKYFWPCSNMQIYKITYHFCQWSKKFECVQKILNTAKKNLTWSKYFWTSRWNRH